MSFSVKCSFIFRTQFPVKMSFQIEAYLQNFLNRCGLSQKPLILGCSGGVDSLALYHALKKCLHLPPLIVLHIDHAWRETSADEALKVKEIISKSGDRCFIEKLNPQELSGNLEDASRKARYALFKHYYQKYNCQALILGHHQDDQSEGVLKRLLEGASLVKISGMSESCERFGMRIFRPFLALPKSTIIAWMEKEGHTFIEDPSNQDTRFLRARMRQEIFPFLEENFAKSIRKNLFYLSKEVEELNHFLEGSLARELEKVHFFKGGWFLPSEEKPKDPFLFRYLLKKLLESYSDALSRDVLEKIIWGNGLKNAWFLGKQGACYLDRGAIFYFKSLPLPGNKCSLEFGQTLFWGAWKLSYLKSTETLEQGLWHSCLEEKIVRTFPISEKVQIEPFSPKLKGLGSKTLDRAWQERAVPALFRKLLPVVTLHDEVILDFTASPQIEHSENEAQIILEYLA